MNSNTFKMMSGLFVAANLVTASAVLGAPGVAPNVGSAPANAPGNNLGVPANGSTAGGIRTAPGTPTSPNLTVPNTPVPNSPNLTSPNTPNLTPPNSPNLTPPNSPNLTPTNNLNLTPQNSPNLTSPNSPNLTPSQAPMATNIINPGTGTNGFNNGNGNNGFIVTNGFRSPATNGIAPAVTNSLPAVRFNNGNP